MREDKAPTWHAIVVLTGSTCSFDALSLVTACFNEIKQFYWIQAKNRHKKFLGKGHFYSRSHYVVFHSHITCFSFVEMSIWQSLINMSSTSVTLVCRMYSVSHIRRSKTMVNELHICR